MPVSRCPVCGADERQALFSIPDRYHQTPGLFCYQRCLSCRTVFQDPMVVSEDIPLCYPQSYYTHEASAVANPPAPGGRRLRDSLRRGVMRAAQGEAPQGILGLLASGIAQSRSLRERAFYSILDECIPRHPPSHRALDIGCGNGNLMNLLIKAGWDPEGLEFDPAAAAAARRATQRTIHCGDLKTLELPLASYGMIVLSHVIEHIPDPRESLRRIAELLIPGGRVVLMYPNPNSLGARIWGEDWFPWEAPRHLVFPTAEILLQQANQCGLSPVSARSVTRNTAPEWFALSRAYRAKRPIFPDYPKTKRVDHLTWHAENFLILMGFEVGEENVVVLERPRLT